LEYLPARDPYGVCPEKHTTDIAIIGWGIAGLASAYSLLHNTDFSVTLLEGNTLASWATGHNAGQASPQFERSFVDLVKQFWRDRAMQAQKIMLEMLDKLEEIVDYMGGLNFPIPYERVVAYDGIVNFSGVIAQLELMVALSDAEVNIENLLVDEEYEHIGNIPESFRDYWVAVPRDTIRRVLETDKTDFIAVAARKTWLLHSALLVEGLAKTLLYRFHDRLTICEHSQVEAIHLHEKGVTLQEKKFHCESDRVVLCTNAYRSCRVFDSEWNPIEVFDLVQPSVACMSGYRIHGDHPSTALVYNTDHFGMLSENPEEYSAPYFYVTRRNLGEEESLVCIGGYEKEITDMSEHCPDDIFLTSEEKLHHYYSPDVPKDPQYRWQGNMAYTSDFLRKVGPHPRFPQLLYNLGCNGIWILPSLYGAERISHIVRWDLVEPSIFDV
jgi:glycine/D-amino acid oxidase-like deaminating enzyme